MKTRIPEKLKKIFIACSLSLILTIVLNDSAISAPQLAGVTAGNVSVTQSPNSTIVNQSSQKAIIQWNSFNIGAGERTQFVQPNASSVALNRINPQQGASQIYGSLVANGRVILVNGAGIHFGGTAQVNVAGLIASTSDISNANFLNGKYVFDLPSQYGGSITNEGSIVAANHGLVALIGSNVTNTGLVQAQLGSIVLGTGDKFTFDFNGDQLVNFSVDAPASTGGTIKNSGKLLSDGGKILITAEAAQGVLDNSINMDGVAQANSVASHNGEIILSAGGGTVNVTGQLIASGKRSNTTGGTVKVLGKHVHLASTASIDVSGPAGGGTALIGGNQHGAGLEQNALTTTIDSGAVINASATSNGNGGNVVVWSDNNTLFSGNIFATGGSHGGNGGNTEVSGGVLQYAGVVDLSAAKGSTGYLLLDPATLQVVTGGTGTVVSGQNDASSTTISPTIVDAALNSANLILNANTNITITNAISWSSGNTLTLSTNTTGSTININAAILGTNGKLVINTAGTSDVISTSSVGAVNVNSFTLQNGAWSQVVGQGSLSAASSLPTFSSVGNFTIQGGTFLRAAGGDGTSTATPYQITDIYGLQGMAGFLNSNFALNNNIDATQTANWNAGAGFSPIGNSPDYFTGSFNGNNYIINKLTMNRSADSYVALFGAISGATIQNVGLTSVNITGQQYVASLVGYSDLTAPQVATIQNVYATGSVTASGDSAGGLVGFLAQGNLSTSYANVTVAGQNGVGGLVGYLSISAGVIQNSYSLGNVLGNDSVGGLVGSIDSNGRRYGMVTNSYSTGAVTGTTNAGGLIGSNRQSDFVNVTNSFWDVTTSGLGVDGDVVGSAGGIGYSTTNLLSANTYMSAGWDLTTSVLAGNTPPSNIWFSFDGRTRPMLMMEYSTNLTNAHQVQLAGSTLGANYTLANDIDFASSFNNASEIWGTNRSTSTGIGFVPIAFDNSSGYPSVYTGTFDGQYHILNNMLITDSPASFSGAAGFIARLDTNGVIENLGLTNAFMTTTNGNTYDVGVLAGTSDGLIQRSFATGTIQHVGAYIGGLVGDMSSGTISDSYADVYINATGAGSVVGLLGSGATVTNSFGLGYATGYVQGGFAFSAGGTITNGFWNVDTVGTNVVSGNSIGLTNAQMQQQSSYTGFDFTNIWAIIPGQSYAYLKGFYPTTPQVVSGTTGSSGGDLVALAVNGVNTSLSTYTGASTVATNSSPINSSAPGFYYFLLPSGTIADGSYLLTYLNNATVKGNAISKVHAGEQNTELNMGANSVNVGDINANNFSSVDLAAASGSLQSSNPNYILYAVAGSNITFNDNTGFGTSANTIYTLDGTITSVSNPGVISGALDFAGRLNLTSDTTFDNSTFTQYFGNLVGPYAVVLNGTGNKTIAGASVGTLTVGNLGDGATTTINGTVIATNDQIYNEATTLGTNDSVIESTAGSVNMQAISWSTGNQLFISANHYIFLNGNVTAPLGTLLLSATNSGGTSVGSGSGVPTEMANSVSVNNFELAQGVWSQEADTLPSFIVNNSFSLGSGSIYGGAFAAEFTRINTNSGLGIDDVFGLQGLATQNTAGNTYLLTGNISASYTNAWINGFIPIGNTLSPFNATFNGGNFVIDYLTVNTVGNAGLFGVTGSSAVISNVGLTNASVTTHLNSTNTGAGILVGSNSGTISEAFSTGSVQSSAGTDNPTVYVGGLVGLNQGNISNAYSLAAVTVADTTSATTYNVGGLVGSNGASGVINETYSAGPVSAATSGTYTGATTLGGLVATNASGTITNSYYDSDASGRLTSAGGTAESTANMQQQSTFAGFDFVNIWGIQANNYPYFTGIYPSGPPTELSGYAPAGTPVGTLLDLAVGGSIISTATTNGNGFYTFLVNSISNGAPIFIYISGSSVIGNLLTYATGTTQSGLNLTANTILVGNSASNTVSNTFLSTSLGSLSDSGILYSVSGVDLTIGNSTNQNVNFITTPTTQYALEGNIYTISGGTSNITFNGPVTLSISPTISLNAGSVTFNGTLDGSTGSEVLTLSTPGGAHFNGVVGNTMQLGGITINQNIGEVDSIGANINTLNGAQTYNNSVLITGASTITLTGAGITFAGTVTGSGQGLVLSDSQTSILGADVTGLSSLMTDAVNITSSHITTSGLQSYGAVGILNNIIFASTAAGSITFNSNIDSGVEVLSNITFADGSGLLTFNGAIGSMSLLNSLSIGISDPTRLNGGSVATSGAQTYGSTVTLGADSVLSGSGISFNNTVSGAGLYALTLQDGSISTFSGAVSGLTTLTTYSVNLAGGSISTSGAQTYNQVTLGSDTTLTSAGGGITFNSTIDGTYGLAIANNSGPVMFNYQIGSSTPLASLTVGTGDDMLFQPSANSVTTTGSQIYNSGLTLTGDTVFTSTGAGSISLMHDLDATGINVTLTGGTGNAFTLAGALSALSISVLGGSGSNSLLVDSTDPESWVIGFDNGGSINGISNITGAFSFSGIQNLIGGSNANTFTMTGGASLSGSITGGSGLNNTLVGDNVNDTFNITGTNSGTVTDVFGNFSQIQNLVGGNLGNTFVFSNNAGVTGTITGGTSADTLDYSAYTTPVNVSLTNDGEGITKNIGSSSIGAFTNIFNIVGDSTGTSTLQLLSNKANTFTVNGAGFGTVLDPVAFTGFTTLIGSSFNNNTVNFSGIYSYSGGNNLYTAYGTQFTLINIQNIGGQEIDPPAPPSPQPPAPSPTFSTSSADDGNNNSNASTPPSNVSVTQVITSGNSGTYGNNPNNSQQPNSSDSSDFSGVLVGASSVVIVVNNNLTDIFQNQQTLDITTSTSQNFATCGG
ncbi:MAG: filamentous hemagglutinin N-terminal domain-containing protein [Gammaproteobacteria bacterium]|nr:filamentous hemagglutinin N-terminal domain-containing protein [Gammaproteobacteria bacterium]